MDFLVPTLSQQHSKLRVGKANSMAGGVGGAVDFVDVQSGRGAAMARGNFPTPIRRSPGDA
jgi:hypothetical protein